MIERVLYAFLRDSEDIRNVVGSRIYAGYAPANTKGPVIILRVISRSRQGKYSLQNETDVTEAVVQIDCYEERASLAFELFENVRKRLSGYYGEVTHVSSTGEETTTYIHSATILREDAVYEVRQDASDKWIDRYSADFQIIHTQPVPTHE